MYMNHKTTKHEKKATKTLEMIPNEQEAHVYTSAMGKQQKDKQKPEIATAHECILYFHFLRACPRPLCVHCFESGFPALVANGEYFGPGSYR